MHRTDQSSPPAVAAIASTSRPSADRRAKSSPSLLRSTSTTALHSTSFALRRSRSKHLRSKTSVDSLPDMISPEEYAALPASIQKKYFSSKERLCIAQQSALQGRKKQYGKLGSWLSSTSTSDLHSARPSTSGGLHSLRPKSRAHDPKLFLVQFDDDSVSEEEARWFLSLPEKVKTKRFSREELVALTAKAHRVLGKAAAESVLEKPKRRQSVHLLESSSSVPIGLASFLSTESNTEDTKITPAPARAAEKRSAGLAQHRRVASDVTEVFKVKSGLEDQLLVQTDQPGSTVDSANAEMETIKSYLQRRSLKPKASAGGIKRSPESPPAAPSQPIKRRSHGRLPLLTPLPLPPPVLAPAPRTVINTPFSTSARLSRPFLNNDPLSLDDDCRENGASAKEHDTEIKDLAAASLQGEGAIFELPANEEPKRIATDEDCPYPHLVSAFSDDESDDGDKDEDDNLDAESVETVGPRTPSPMDYPEAAVQQTGADSGVDIPDMHFDARPKTPSVLNRTSSSYSDYGSSHNSLGSHPSALRTSSEDILYAHQRRLTSGVDVETSDPLALETLPVCDDETGAHGAFAVSHAHQPGTMGPNKSLKKVFKSLTRL